MEENTPLTFDFIAGLLYYYYPLPFTDLLAQINFDQSELAFHGRRYGQGGFV